MKTTYIARIPPMDMLYDGLRVTTFLIVVFWCIIRRKPVSMVVVLIAVWRFFLIYSTIVNEGTVYNCIVESFSIISVVLLYDTAYSTYDIGMKKTFLSAQLFCFELYIYINLITEILFPDGMFYTEGAFSSKLNWFLGYYNNHSNYYIPALLIGWLYNEYVGKSIRTLFMTLAIFISAALVWSGGTIAALSAMVIVYLFLKNWTFIFNYYSYWLLHIIFLLSIIILKMQDRFIWLINGVLGKWNSIMSRIAIWQKTLVLIHDKLFLGHGDVDSFLRAAEYHLGWGAVHSHNMLMEILYEGGLIALITWLIIIIVSGKMIYKYRDLKESKIVATAFLGWCVATLVEPFTSSFLMGMFVIAYYSYRGKKDTI